jgi:hypothetical protein
VYGPVESCGLAFLNPPYDWTLGENRSERTERVFLAHTYRWLKTGGVLILVIPAAHVRECGEILASQFKATRILRLTDPESVRYRQVMVLAARRSRRERDQLRDNDVVARSAQFANIGANYERLAPWATSARRCTMSPRAAQPSWNAAAFHSMRSRTCYRGPQACRQAARILFPQPAHFKGRPLTPLHAATLRCAPSAAC